MKIDAHEIQGLSKPVWEEGVVLKKADKTDPAILLEFVGIISIPLLGLLIFFWEATLYSFLLFLITLLLSYEIVIALRNRNIRIYKEGLEVNEKMHVLQGGAVCATPQESAFISWDKVDGIDVYQPMNDTHEAPMGDTLNSIDTIASILDEDHDIFFNIKTKEGEIYRGKLRNEKSLRNLKATLKALKIEDLLYIK
jgi:hypothetical protein